MSECITKYFLVPRISHFIPIAQQIAKTFMKSDVGPIFLWANGKDYTKPSLGTKILTS